LLKANGLAFLEMGQDQGPAVAEIMAGAGLGTRKIVPDLAGIGRGAVLEHGSVTEKTVGSRASNR
jgi:methylase of polypeptide subunit release factors